MLPGEGTLGHGGLARWGLVMRGEDPLWPVTVTLAMRHLTNTVQAWA